MLFLAQAEEVEWVQQEHWPLRSGLPRDLQPLHSEPCQEQIHRADPQLAIPRLWIQLELGRQCHTQPRWPKPKQLLLVTSHCLQICFPSSLASAPIIPAADPAGKQLCTATWTQSKGKANSQPEMPTWGRNCSAGHGKARGLPVLELSSPQDGLRNTR